MKKAALILLSPMLAHATLNLNVANRGESTVSRARGEVCIIPKKIPGAQYSKKDIETEIGLCNLEISQNAAVCGKDNSTNPGLQFFKIKDGYTVSQMEAMNCFKQDPGKEAGANLFKNLAKYKSSTSCSYTPSLLAYYHISRFLGDINQVPVAVLRTVDRNLHIGIGEKAIPTLKGGSLIATTWGSFLSFLRAGPKMSNKDKMNGIFTDDFKQSYGALQKNPNSESKYAELFHNGEGQPARAANFRDKNPSYLRDANSSALENIVSKNWNQESLQEVLRMQNVADMVLLDTILSQEDRFGNMHYTMEAYALNHNEQGETVVEKLDKLEDGETYPPSTLQVKKLMMKDNDCGVNRANHIKDAKLLEGLKHFNPETYTKLLKLKALLNTAAGSAQARIETTMTESDMATLKANISYAVNVLQTKCRAGQLKLDLDLDTHFGNVTQNVSCE